MITTALTTELLLITLFGGLICLDRRGAFQIMISQPLVVVPLMGFALGNLPMGLWLGAILQLLWLSTLMVGTNVPQNETVAAVVIGGVAMLYPRHCVGAHCGPPGEHLDVLVATLAILLGTPTALIARLMDVRNDRANLAMLAKADAAAKAGAPRTLTLLLLAGLARIFLSAIVVIGPGLCVGVILIMIIEPALNVPLRRAIEVVGQYVIPALGFSVALSTLRRRRALLMAAISFVVAVTVLHQEGVA